MSSPEEGMYEVTVTPTVPGRAKLSVQLMAGLGGGVMLTEQTFDVEE